MEQEAFYDVGNFDRSKVDLSKPAMSVEEYMQQVIVDRERIPAVVVASEEVLKRVNVSSSKVSIANVIGIQEGSSFTSRFSPSKEWCISKSNEFSKDRSMIEAERAPKHVLKGLKVPAVSDSMRWCQVCFESRLEGFEINPEDEQCFANHKGTPPTKGLIKSLNDNQVNELILHQIDYMLQKGFTRATLEWLYSLLLVVKKPLIQEICSCMRDFCRKCKEWRAELDEDEEDIIYQLSLFITIISIYFAQRDLADYQ